ncbi:MAG: FAD:protein FMN transferase [Rhodospirillaceae bacterium]
MSDHTQPNPLSRPLSRRRVLQIGASAGTLLAVPRAVRATAPRVHRLSWQGWALGAQASATLLAADRAEGHAALAALESELRRLEAVFSLFQRDSSLSRLNRAGVLTDPPSELVEVLRQALEMASWTGGQFDPSVQPLWQLHAAAAQQGRQASAEDIKAARALVNWRAVEVSEAEIRFQRLGMAVSLNGIAQGAITDRLADLLATRGFGDLLLDLGEMRGAGAPSLDRPWRIALPGWTDPLTLGALGDYRALATSATDGTPLLPGQGVHHLFDPSTGRSSATPCRVTVAASTACLADGLSTALALLPVDKAAPLLHQAGAHRAWIATGAALDETHDISTNSENI